MPPTPAAGVPSQLEWTKAKCLGAGRAGVSPYLPGAASTADALALGLCAHRPPHIEPPPSGPSALF